MEKYYQTDELQKLIDWDNLMNMSRYAGGHDEQMIGLFKDAELIAHYNEGDYQGQVATCVKLPSGEFAIYNDYYGSCSGCDAWEDATDEDVRKLVIDLSNSAYIFQKLEDVKFFLKNVQNDNNWSSWSGVNLRLLENIEKGKNDAVYY